jgi:tetratricopeptide (TPR) repeat protein
MTMSDPTPARIRTSRRTPNTSQLSSTMKHFPAVITMAVLAALCAPRVLAQDTGTDVISLRDGRRLRGVEITSATATAVHYKRKAEASEIPTVLVLDIEWGGQPEEVAQAKAAMRTGDAAGAANLFMAAAGKTGRAPLKAEYEFLAAEALQRGSARDKAGAAEAARRLEAWIGANADSMRMPDALMALGRAQVGAEAFPEAEGTFKKLADDAVGNGWSAIWGARGKLGLANAQMARGDFANARATFASAATALGALSEEERKSEEAIAIEAEALVGTGESMIQQGKFADALSYFRDEVGRRATTDAIRAAAKAGEGEAIYLQAKNGGSGDDLRKAQIAFADANLLDDVGGATTAKALYYTGLILLALGPDRDGPNVQTRAAEYFESVTREYADTRWAALAAAELKR